MNDSEKLSILRQKTTDALEFPPSLIGGEDAQAVIVVAHAIHKRARLGGMALGAMVLKTGQVAEIRSLQRGEHLLMSNGENYVKNSNINK